MTLDEAKSMMNEDALNKLKDVVTTKPVINMENKANCDILMQALCRAVSAGIIKESSISEKLIKLLNSSTNTLTESKLNQVLKSIHKYQPSLYCQLTLKTSDLQNVISNVIFQNGVPEHSFQKIFGFVIDKFNITPQLVRVKMVDTLKPTIVNNIAQLVARFQDPNQRETLNISINNINRLVNMVDHVLIAEFNESK